MRKYSAEVKKLFDKVEAEAKKKKNTKEKELIAFVGPYSIHLWHFPSLLMLGKKWKVVVYCNKEEAFEKCFKNYKDALEFYDECVSEAYRRGEGTWSYAVALCNSQEAGADEK